MVGRQLWNNLCSCLHLTCLCAVEDDWTSRCPADDRETGEGLVDDGVAGRRVHRPRTRVGHKLAFGWRRL